MTDSSTDKALLITLVIVTLIAAVMTREPVLLTTFQLAVVSVITAIASRVSRKDQ